MTDAVCDLSRKQCKPCEGGIPALSPIEAGAFMQQLSGWELYEERITKTYRFKNYYQTMAFVNAVAWIAHREDHHPDMMVGYNQCVVTYTTHAVNGLSENDFICAAKTDSLSTI